MDATPLLIIGSVLWGIVIGLLVGFTSIGTGLIGVPGLIWFFGLDAVKAVGTMGLGGGVMMVAATYNHFREGNVETRVAGLFTLTALPASFLAAYWVKDINNVINLKLIVGVMIVLATAALFYRFVIMKPQPRVLDVTSRTLLLAAIVGIVTGALMGATSIAGSPVMISFLMILKLPSPYAVGTACAVSAVSLLCAAVAHTMEGNIDWTIEAGLVAGLVIGAFIGSKLVNKVPRQALRYGILGILAVAGIILIIRSL